MREVPYPVAAHLSSELRRARRQRDDWRRWYWLVVAVCAQTWTRDHWHLPGWGSFLVFLGVYSAACGLELWINKREREKDAWIRRHL